MESANYSDPLVLKKGGYQPTVNASAQGNNSIPKGVIGGTGARAISVQTINLSAKRKK